MSLHSKIINKMRRNKRRDLEPGKRSYTKKPYMPAVRKAADLRHIPREVAKRIKTKLQEEEDMEEIRAILKGKHPVKFEMKLPNFCRDNFFAGYNESRKKRTPLEVVDYETTLWELVRDPYIRERYGRGVSKPKYQSRELSEEELIYRLVSGMDSIDDIVEMYRSED